MPDQSKITQLELGLAFDEPAAPEALFIDPAFASNKAAPIHRWVPWIAGFSKDFVEHVLAMYLPESDPGTVLDPFAGVGTTLVEAAQAGHDVVGFEINPYPYLAARTKLNAAQLPVDALREHITAFTAHYADAVHTGREPASKPPQGFRTRIPFYSEAVLAKVLHVFDFIAQVEDEGLRDVFRLAFASTMIRYSNYSYEPSLATRSSSGKALIQDYPVGETIRDKLLEMLDDVTWLQAQSLPSTLTPPHVFNDSFFNAARYVPPDSVDLIITSPPYLNNYHYNRNTRPHLYWLGYATSPSDLKPLEHANFGTYWQTVRDLDSVELAFTLPHFELEEKLALLRKINVEKGIYGGNGWANYAAQYFNDSYRFAKEAHRVLRPGQYAVVVIGNSILQGIDIPTDRYLAQIAEGVGLETVVIDVPRATRVGSSIIQSEVRAAKAGKKAQLYEAVVVLRKSG